MAHAPSRSTFGVVSALYGICLMGLGALALAAPALSGLAVALTLGAILAAAGVLGALAAVRDRAAPGFWSKLAWAALSFLLGLWLLTRPALGAASVALALGAVFVLRGALAAAFAVSRRQTLGSGWWWVLLSAAATVALGAAILAGWPGTSLIALGIIIGVDLLFLGAALVAAAFAVSRTAGP